MTKTCNIGHNLLCKKQCTVKSCCCDVCDVISDKLRLISCGTTAVVTPYPLGLKTKS